MLQKRILFVLTSHDELGETGEETGYDLREAARPWSVLKSAGFEVDFITTEGGEPPQAPDSVDLEDEADREFADSDEVHDKLLATETAADVRAEDYAAIFFVGGHGAMWDFPNDASLHLLTSEIWENGGVVAAVCHGPAGLVNVELSNGEYLVAGKDLTSFTNDEERTVDRDDVVPFLLADKLEERGANHTQEDEFEEYVVVDGRLITGQNPASARAVGEAIARTVTGLDDQVRQTG